MIIRYYVGKRGVWNGTETNEKYLAKIDTPKIIGFDKVCEQVAAMTTFSKADIAGVMIATREVMTEWLTIGYGVSLGELGNFVPSIKVDTKDTAEEVNNKTIKQLKCIYKPSKYIKASLKKVVFRRKSKKS